MIKVYQIQLSDAEVDDINSGVQSPKSKAYFARSLDSLFKPEFFEHYSHVCTVDATNMEVAFHLMNLWEDESKIKRFGPCSSMSVGDILEMDGKFYRCASFGFEDLNWSR